MVHPAAVVEFVHWMVNKDLRMHSNIDHASLNGDLFTHLHAGFDELREADTLRELKM